MLPLSISTGTFSSSAAFVFIISTSVIASLFGGAAFVLLVEIALKQYFKVHFYWLSTGFRL